jgi:energy-coupling factor transporter ATP-binding protein EcfA2
MLISRLVIKNILGIEQLEFKAGKFVYISGPNGSGKSTVLEAIKSVFKGGHDATLLRLGAEKGEIVLELDDGTEFTKTVRPHTSNLVAKRDGRSLPRPAELIKTLVDQLSNNPISFLTENDESKRVGVLLQSMPVNVDLEKLAQISGVRLPENASNMHVYQLFDHVHDTVYDDRTGTNRAVDEKKKTIKQLTEAMPDLPEGVIGGEDELDAQLTALDAQKDRDLTEVHEKLTAYSEAVNLQVAASTSQHDGVIQTYVDSIDAEIAALQRQLEAKRAEKMQEVTRMRDAKTTAIRELQDKVTSVTARADAKRILIKEQHRETRGPIETQLGILRGNRDLAAKRTTTQDTIKTLEGELQHLEQDVLRQNKALGLIDQYKSEVLKNLPIRGLEVRNGKIYRDGVAFDRLNQAQRVDIAVEIAKLRAGELGVICVDGIEALDDHTLGLFKERAGETDLQFFVSHVANTPFRIDTDQPTF